MRRMALYARVSSARQEQEETIESQLEQIKAYAQQQASEIAPELEYIDRAVSGEYLARPGLDRLRDGAAAGAFQVLVVYHIDRLARNLGAQCVVLDELERAGVEVIFLNQPDLGNGPEAKLLLNIQGAFAEYERVLIQERMRRGRLYRLRHGQSVPSGAPYGYRYAPARPGQPSAWVPVPEEVLVVQQVFAWYNAGEVSLKQLAKQLNQNQTPSPQGAQWYDGTVGRLLRQPAYKGTAYYNRHRTDYSGLGQRRRRGQGRLRSPRYQPRPTEEWIAISVPALVDEAVWQAAQERLKMNERFAQRNSQHTYLLRGLLVCGTCERTLQGRTQRGIVYYRCPHGGSRRPPGVARHTCSVRGDVVEPRVWQALSDLLKAPQRIQQAWEALQQEQTPTAGEAQRWLKRQALLQKQRQRLLDAYQIGAIALDELVERQNPLDVELTELARHLATAEPAAPPEIELPRFTQLIEQALAASDLETQQEVIRLLIERIVVTDEALTVEHIVSTVNNSRLHVTHRDA